MTLPRNKKLVFLVGLALACFLVFLGVYLVHGLTRITTDDAYVAGRVHSISFKVAGTVMKVAVNDNQPVKKGDLLVELDPADYELGVKEAQAVLSAEQARLLDADASIKAAMANLEIQEVTLQQASLDKQRADALFKEEVITKERYEKATTAYALAAAQVKAAKEQLAKANSLKGLEESLVTQRDAAVKIAQLALGYARLFAPADGYVTNKSVEAGNQVQPGQPLMAVVALDDIWVIANYKETQLRNVRRGQPVRIKVDTYAGKVFTGKVDSLMAGTGAVFSLFPPENALGNYVKVVQRIPVKIVLDKASDERHVLRIGMSCVATILTGNE
ncbi:MAG TPA: HlyD family secretion protein [Patescibacteria group bacterium]|nr:HlyD family secretion protein [Patescibacteria group bacterium]